MEDFMDKTYSAFEQRLALTWAQSCLAKFDAKFPDATGKERCDEFLEAVEGGLNLALEFGKDNG